MMPSTPGPWTSRASSDWQLRAHWNRGRRGMRSTPASGRAVTLKPVRIEGSTIIRIGIPTGKPWWRAGTTRGWRSCRRTARVGPLPCASDASSQSWLCQAARTTIADQWRDFYKCHALSLDRLCEKGWDVGEREPVRPQADTNPLVKRLPERLPERYRAVLTYRFLLNYSIGETADKMGVAKANAKVLQFRALKQAIAYDRAD